MTARHGSRILAASLGVLIGCQDAGDELPSMLASKHGGEVLEDVAPQSDSGSNLPHSLYGRTQTGNYLVLPALPPDGAALIVTAAEGQDGCFRMDSLLDQNGAEMLDQVESSNACDMHSAVALVARQRSLTLLPPRPEMTTTALRSVRIGAADCATGLPIAEYRPPLQLNVQLLPLSTKVHRAPPKQTLRLAAYIDGTDLLGGQAKSILSKAIEMASIEYEQAGVDIELTSVCVFDSGATSIDFGPGKADTLRRVWRTARALCPGQSQVIPLVVGGCLRRLDGKGTPHAYPQGETTHIPGWAGDDDLADLVVLAGRECPHGEPANWTPWAASRVIAHEIGHYLGLYHCAEVDVASRSAPAESVGNLMMANPLVSSAHGFTQWQVRALRRHPLLQGVESATTWPESY
jgi:hypothetical protein